MWYDWLSGARRVWVPCFQRLLVACQPLKKCQPSNQLVLHDGNQLGLAGSSLLLRVTRTQPLSLVFWNSFPSSLRNASGVSSTMTCYRLLDPR